jgi:recombination protein RecR
MNFSSKLLEQAVNEFSGLPGIGQKTALRLVLHLLNQDNADVDKFTFALLNLKNNIKYCNQCHNIADHAVCEICLSHKRDRSLVCVVEDTRDVMAIENTNQYHGLYHVLGGLISPMDGVGPSDLAIESLVERLKSGEIKEIIFAISATMEGDTTIFYLHKKLKIYADELTLGRSITTRVLYENSLMR